MIGGILQTAVFSGGGIQDVFNSWQQAGVFTYLIPFLLLFALIFGIMTQVNLFKENKAIPAIISLAVSLMALQFSTVTNFFSEIFPRVGIGLVVLLVFMVLLGLFAPNRTWVTYIFFGAAAVVLVVVLVNTATATQWLSSGFLAGINWQTWLPWIVLLALVLVVVIGSTAKRVANKPQDISSKFMQSIFGGAGGNQ